MTSVVPLRSTFHPLPKLTGHLQGSTSSGFFPSSALYFCQYLIYFVTVLLPCKLLFPSHVKEKALGVTSIYHYPKRLPFASLPGHPILFSSPAEDHPSPHIHFPSLSPVSVTIKVLTSWRHNDPGGNTSQVLQHRARCLAGPQQHPRARLRGMLLSAPWAARVTPPPTKTHWTSITLPLYWRPLALRHGVWDLVQELLVGTHFSFCLGQNRLLMCITLQ